MPQVPPPKRHPYDQWSPDARALDLVGDKWSLLIVRDLSAGALRFVELQRVLPGISTEQLRSRLNRMVAEGMLTRQRFREVPPRVEYALTERAEELMPVLAALARWGYEWAWSPPRSGEAVDIGAIFRLAGGLLPAEGFSGTIVLSVRENGNETPYTITGGPDGVSVAERDDVNADARVTGSPTAWVKSLSPDHDRAGLQMTGDSALASRVLDWVSGGTAGATVAAASTATGATAAA
jgi:DNA-binding HxlR family transcriptional regulator